MPKSTKQERRKAWTTIAVFCAMLIGGTMWAAVLLPPEEMNSVSVREGEKTSTTTAAYRKILKAWEGSVALFESGEKTPVTVYEIYVNSLPEEEQQRLIQGITLDSEEQLLSILENYTS